jgi:acyl transferase domain-containing protein
MSNRATTAFGDAAVAVIGLAGRFPRAASLDEFWRNLQEGLECVSRFSMDELRASGIPSSLYDQPGYVPARAVLDDVELFDAPFFGLSPRDAAFIDPQHRIFLECAYEALENAGYDAERCEDAIGVYAGASTNSYLLAVLSHAELVAAVNDFQTIVGNDKDFLATRVAYHLNLRGPCVNVHTACSTSLVAVHLACQALLAGECEMALAGGVSVRVPQRSGYLYQEGGILSADGHCRAFDAAASGTVGGNGAGVVLLKRLASALEDGDRIRCVIRGSAINNDGATKVGFTAPSVSGQASVIAEALGIAGIVPDDISYVEAHGTGTLLGDPIEVAALDEVFRSNGRLRHSCAIGSVKTNIGHLDAAAGVAGLIKTILALEHRQLPPSANFNSPNPQVPFEASGFHVIRQLTPWEAGSKPRRAGVSSFGIGGTNAHVVLEEAPEPDRRAAVRPVQALVLSARTASALDAATTRLCGHLAAHPTLELADVAFTLQTGRKAFRHRRAIVCRDRDAAVQALEHARGTSKDAADGAARPVVFMFPGQGSQAVNMGRELYEWLPQFRDDVDTCARRLEALLELDIRALLYPKAPDEASAAERLNETQYSQPALFVIEYALARLWLKWGVHPAAMIGHSLGEYVAACLAGVFPVEDALSIVAARGRLMQQLPAGAMFSVNLSADEVMPMLGSSLSLAAVNAPAMCVVSGPVADVASLASELQRQQRDVRSLSVTRAFHSCQTDAILEAFREELSEVALAAPQIPYISNVTGTWIRPEEAASPQYWIDHLRHTVRFADGLQMIVAKEKRTLLEVGPGRALSTLARLQLDPATTPLVLMSLGDTGERRSALETMLSAAAQLWTAGADIRWSELHRHGRRRRVPLPTYPFERRRCWIDSRPTSQPVPPAVFAQDAVPAETHPRPAVPVSYVPPSSDVEHTLAAIWSELLGIERIGVHDNFFDLGGHSLLLTRLIARVREAFEVDLPLQDLFQSPTIARLGHVITAQLLAQVEQMTEEEARRLLE